MLGLVELNISLVIQLINFLVLFLVLRHFLFKPVTNFMEKRKQGIEDSIADAERKNKEADDLKSQYDLKIKEIRKERNEIIEEATKKAQQRSEEIIRTAQDEASKILEKANLDIQRERKRAMNELKGEVSQLAIIVAEKVIEKDLDQRAHEQIIQQFIDEVGETRWQN